MKICTFLMILDMDTVQIQIAGTFHGSSLLVTIMIQAIRRRQLFTGVEVMGVNR